VLGEEAQAELKVAFEGFNDDVAMKSARVLAQTLADPATLMSLRAILNPSNLFGLRQEAFTAMAKLEANLQDLAPGFLLLVYKKVLAALLPALNMHAATIQGCKDRHDLLIEVVKLALEEMRTMLEPKFPKEISWDKITQMGLVTMTIDELLTVSMTIDVSNPASFRRVLEQKFFRAIWKSVSQEMTMQLRDSKFAGINLEEVIELVDFEDIQHAIRHPNQFLEMLARRTGQAALKLIGLSGCIFFWRFSEHVQKTSHTRYTGHV